ncbi:MAG: type I-MYXAN CRISPR-associated Cas8a1/Cmx1 [Thermoanaerobaculia bacterium]|nr:type I-MYXAN CRISPR-associated Cas8a1/Cmx1 [Thermoanaerobaculia bacterium]
MGKTVKKSRAATGAEIAPLQIRLSDPGLTPMLRAGLGGLAASLRAIRLEEAPDAPWPSPIPVGKGFARVEPRGVRLEWGGAPPEDTLRPLFERSFRTGSKSGLIELPGTWPFGPPPLPLAVQNQEALKRTFLQHGKSTTKRGEARAVTVELDETRLSFQYQPYEVFAHQSAWEDVVVALKKGHVRLKGWAYPGAVQRHIGYPDTVWEYSAAAAICACFALVGCIPYSVPNVRGGAIVIPDPSDLVLFARSRGRLGPGRPDQCAVAGAGDAVLSAALALRAETVLHGGPGVAGASAVLLRSTPWAGKQKNRTSIVAVGSVPSDVLDLYESAAAVLPARIRASRKGRGGETDGGVFVTTSALREFVADNLAQGNRWYEGFSTAKTGPKADHFVHYFHGADRNDLGALYPEEKEGLSIMVESLGGAERSFVRSVHAAVRSRFGAIASEAAGATATMKNRFQGERERWRLAFSGAKTPEQIRAALADLWSRGGSNPELRENWEEILPLLRPERWQEARDLALVALASYKGQRPEEESESA